MTQQSHGRATVVQRSCASSAIAGRSCNSRTTVARPSSDRATVVRVLHDLQAIVRSLLRSHDRSCNGRTTLLRSKSIASGRSCFLNMFKTRNRSQTIAVDRMRHAIGRTTPCDRSCDRLRSLAIAIASGRELAATQL